jgi:hypothetical protein
MSDNQQQRIDSATCDVVCDAMRGNVDAVRKWLHGDGRYKVKKQTVVLYRATEEGHTDICQLVVTLCLMMICHNYYNELSH